MVLNKEISSNLKIRKLTPKECFRLMGVKDEDYERCAKNQSEASLYHLAGATKEIEFHKKRMFELLNLTFWQLWW